ncbi:hypothetical protein B0H14DRAFT_2857909 [Mycena olivaceomarginata]|nr:hypothetical protein B0H14DRAFT_2857909 [Mycena olivaceomarginata]
MCARELYEFLARPQFKSYASTLHRLFIPSLLKIGTGAKLLLVTAPVEHLHFKRLGLSGPVFTPALPLLRSVEFSLAFHQIATPWFLDLVSSTFSPVPNDVIISIPEQQSSPWTRSTRLTPVSCPSRCRAERTSRTQNRDRITVSSPSSAAEGYMRECGGPEYRCNGGQLSICRTSLCVVCRLLVGPDGCDPGFALAGLSPVFHPES